MADLSNFILTRMSMTEIYQPVILKALIENGGIRTKEQLAETLAEHDVSVVEYYRSILMRWPKITLEKHGVIKYDQKKQLFELIGLPDRAAQRQALITLCDEKINEWSEKKRKKGGALEKSASLRYEVLKKANGKCQLCGVPSSLRPLHVDHIIPQSKANKSLKVLKDGRLIDVNSIDNLQALCFECNCGKRDGDDSDFRKSKKLVRDKIPEIIRADGRNPIIKKLKQPSLMKYLEEKLIEEHVEFINESREKQRLEELADIIEVAIAIANQYHASEKDLLKIVKDKRRRRGGFLAGYLYEGDAV